MTMTLKDFHGGSIPSQLVLPSAPGSNINNAYKFSFFLLRTALGFSESIRRGKTESFFFFILLLCSSARPNDRPGAWGIGSPSGAGRSDLQSHHFLRPRPGSAGAGSASARTLDERPAVFLSHPTHIGRHFDEDERKPFDASSAPRRAAAPDDTLRSPASFRSETKHPILSPIVPSPVVASVPAPGPVSRSPPPPSNVGSAWGPRKEVGSDPPPSLPTQPVLSASRLAQASAVEKVSSGRWHLKSPEVETIRPHDREELERRFGETVRTEDGIDRDRERENPKSASSAVTYAEVKERTLPGSYSVRVQNQHRAKSPMYPEVNEKQTTGYLIEGVRPASSDGMFTGSKVHEEEVLERPKLKLLPRRKPLESLDIQIRDFNDKQAYQVSMNSVQVQNIHEMHGNSNVPKPGLAGADEGNRAIERPRLNLMPRSHPIEQTEGNGNKERKNVFGGARPRELVLKERGIDIAANEVDMIRSPNRARNDLPKSDSKTETNSSIQLGERVDRLSVGQRTVKDLDNRGYHPDNERVDVQNSSWRNDNRKNTRDIDRSLAQPRADVDNWRKPVEDPKPEVPAPRFSKGATALELAQAFSRSVSDARPENKISTQRNISGQNQLPFSRLAGSKELYSGTTHRQINGY
ncbi:hypothetical protein ZIOFF_022557 [Zingiber officinale]|uniref:Eukaryotic translation initiation factor-related n=1 Tax=Zingiber officinale TaxID=94328 RepID=A0A8J5H5C4_ZINOF|nr:hypothetical protein ZIOFF_022557 [Zingiber officinale]